MISKEQFVLLINGLKNQEKYEDSFNSAIHLINTSHTVVELSPALTDAIFDVFRYDFTDTGINIIWDFVLSTKKIFEWDERDTSGKYQSLSYKIINSNQLYNAMIQHFSYEK